MVLKFSLFLLISCVLTSCSDNRREELLCFTKNYSQPDSIEFKYHLSLDFSNPLYYYFWSQGTCKAEAEISPNIWKYQSEGTSSISHDTFICDATVLRDKGFQPKQIFKINRTTGSVSLSITAEKRITQEYGYCQKVSTKL